MARAKFRSQFDIIQIQNTRERRRIVGDIVLQPTDFYANRTYRDTVVQAMSNFDTHGFVVHPMFMLQPPTRDGHFANVPFRALLPKGLENIAATGLAVSAQRDCLPLIRMQPDVQNQGYAVGYAAAMAVKTDGTYRTLDMRALQRHLVEKKILPESVLSEEDGIPGVPAEDPHFELATIFMSPEERMPGLEEAYDKNPSDIRTARVLAFLGERRVTWMQRHSASRLNKMCRPENLVPPPDPSKPELTPPYLPESAAFYRQPASERELFQVGGRGMQS